MLRAISAISKLTQGLLYIIYFKPFLLPFFLQESLNSGSYDIMERGDDDDEKSKKVTIGKTTEIPYKFSRKNTLLGNNS